MARNLIRALGVMGSLNRGSRYYGVTWMTEACAKDKRVSHGEIDFNARIPGSVPGIMKVFSSNSEVPYHQVLFLPIPVRM